MAYEPPGALALDCLPCRFGAARLVVRGPRVALDAAYVAAVGGSATFGKGLAEPWPARLGRHLGLPVANLGCLHAGPDAFLGEPELCRIAAAARLRLLEVSGAINLTNPYYSVHPRRNDRFIAASARLRTLYPEVDFTEFHFTRHLVLALARRGPERFATLAAALRDSWSERMAALLAAIGRPTILVWIVGRPPPPVAAPAIEPALVDQAMLAAMRAQACATVEVVLPAPGPGRADGVALAAAHEAAARRIAAAAARHL
jgi:hypothetical protein